MNAVKATSSFSGTRTIDVIVVMVAGLFFANMVLQPGERSETVQIYAAQVEASVKTMD